MENSICIRDTGVIQCADMFVQTLTPYCGISLTSCNHLVDFFIHMIHPRPTTFIKTDNDHLELDLTRKYHSRDSKLYLFCHFSTTQSLIETVSDSLESLSLCEAAQISAPSKLADTGKVLLPFIVATTESPMMFLIRFCTVVKHWRFECFFHWTQREKAYWITTFHSPLHRSNAR